MTKSCFILFFACVIFQSCCNECYDEDDIGNGAEYSAYEPIYWSRADFDSSIQLKPAQDIINSGKIYVIGDLLFVGEKREGFHVFDNSNVQNPMKIKFIQVHGSTDMAVRNNILYINQATDLITLQYDFVEENLKLVKRIENTFPELRSPDGYLVYDVPEDSVVIDWKLKN
jgi:hypothetical protein